MKESSLPFQRSTGSLRLTTLNCSAVLTSPFVDVGELGPTSQVLSRSSSLAARAKRN